MALTQISTAGVKDDAVTSGKIPANAVGSSELADNAVDTAAIAADAVTGAKIADDAINSEHYTDGSIDTAHIADDAVTSQKIADSAITTALIADGAVGHNDLASASVYGAKIASDAITTDKIANEAVTLAKLPHGTSSNDGKFLRANNGADPTFETVSGTTINSNSDNRVITGSGTANTLNAESTFTHDPSTCDTTIQHNANVPADLIIQNDSSGTAAGARLTLQSGSAANTGPQFDMRVGSDSWTLQTPKNAGALDFNDNGSLAFKMAGSGNFDVITGDVTINGSGKGIDFAQGANTGTAANILDDYEEGSFTPSYAMTSGGHNITYYDQQGQYTKVGRVVHFQIYLRINVVNANGSGILYVDGLPFTAVSNTGQGPAFGCVSFGYMDTIQGMNGTDSPVGYVEANATRIYLYLFPDNSGHAVNMTVANNLANNSKIMMAGSYQV